MVNAEPAGFYSCYPYNMRLGFPGGIPGNINWIKEIVDTKWL